MRSSELGGQTLIAKRAPARQDFDGATRWSALQCGKSGVDIRLETAATVEVVLAESPDAVIVATGATARRPPIENMEDVRFVSAWDVLRDEHDIGNVVVIDENYGHQVRALPNIFWTAAKKSISSRSRRRLGPFSEPPRDHHS